MKSIVSATTVMSIPFFDCDPMAICWHGHYAKYLELARCDLFEKIDYGYTQMLESGYSWPIIDFQVRYIQALKYEQRIEIESEMVEYENYIKINYLIYDQQSRQKLTKGMTKQVAVRLQDVEMQIVSPDILREKLADYL